MQKRKEQEPYLLSPREVAVGAAGEILARRAHQALLIDLKKFFISLLPKSLQGAFVEHVTLQLPYYPWSVHLRFGFADANNLMGTLLETSFQKGGWMAITLEDFIRSTKSDPVILEDIVLPHLVEHGYIFYTPHRGLIGLAPKGIESILEQFHQNIAHEKSALHRKTDDQIAKVSLDVLKLFSPKIHFYLLQENSPDGLRNLLYELLDSLQVDHLHAEHIAQPLATFTDEERERVINWILAYIIQDFRREIEKRG